MRSPCRGFMNPEPFASGIVSLVLAWLLAVPVLLGTLAGSAHMLFARTEDDLPRWFMFWIMLCILVFSPFRYIVLQLLIASAFPVQSVSAFVSLFPLALYVPIVFGLLCGIGL